MAKMLRKPSKDPVAAVPVLGRIEGDIFVIRPTPLNKKPYNLLLVERSTRFRVVRGLKTKDEAYKKAESVFRGLFNTYGR